MYRRHFIFIYTLALSLLYTTAFANQLAAEDVTEPATLNVQWKSGLLFSHSKHIFEFRIGGRLHLDFASFTDHDLPTALQSPLGVEVRRARLAVSGTIYKRALFKAEFDFASSDIFKDIYVGFQKIPGIGTLKIGHFKEPFNLNEFMSSNAIRFLEPALPTAFAPSRNLGIMFENNTANDRVYYALGVFRDTSGIVSKGDKNIALTARLTGLPYQHKNGLIHLGLAGSYRRTDGDIKFEARPEAHLANKYLQTTALPTKNLYLLGAEWVSIAKFFHLSAEYIQAFVDVEDGAPNAFFNGFYLETGFFLTGEQLPYKNNSATPDRVTPKKSIFTKGGTGAWEIAARLSLLNLNSDSYTFGKLFDVTTGLNWYLNPYVKVMFNYVFANLSPDNNQAHIVQSRLQVAF